DGERRREDSRGGRGRAPARHRHRLDLRLRLPGLSRRAHVLGRPGGPEDDLRGRTEVSAAVRGGILEAGAAARAAGAGGQGLLLLARTAKPRLSLRAQRSNPARRVVPRRRLLPRGISSGSLAALKGKKGDGTLVQGLRPRSPGFRREAGRHEYVKQRTSIRSLRCASLSVASPALRPGATGGMRSEMDLCA